MKPPGAAFLTETVDLYHTDLTGQDVDAGAVPVDTAFATAEPCSVQRRSVTRDTSGNATVQVTKYSLFFGRDTGLLLDDKVVTGGKTLRVIGLLDGFEAEAEGRS